MYYNLSTYEPRQKFGHDHLGKQSYGKNKIIYQYDEQISEEDEEIDDFVDDINNINSKISTSGKVSITDFGRARQDNAGPAKNQPLGLMEYFGNHTNPIRKGISPYKQPKHSGPSLGTGGSGQAFKTTGNYFYTGTQYGTSRKPLPRHDEDDDPIFNSYDLFDEDKVENNYMKHQNRVNKVLKMIEEE